MGFIVSARPVRSGCDVSARPDSLEVEGLGCSSTGGASKRSASAGGVSRCVSTGGARSAPGIVSKRTLVFVMPLRTRGALASSSALKVPLVNQPWSCSHFKSSAAVDRTT
jgi:hypothetical protein